MSSYSVDILSKTVFERELADLLAAPDKKESIIEYFRRRIDDIKAKHGI